MIRLANSLEIRSCTKLSMHQHFGNVSIAFFFLDGTDLVWEKTVDDILEKFHLETAGIFRQFYEKCHQSGIRIDREEFINLVIDR